MYTIQQYDYVTEVTTFQEFDNVSDALVELRSNRGLDEGQFLEFVYLRVYDRPGVVFIGMYEGTAPSTEAAKAAALSRVPTRK